MRSGSPDRPSEVEISLVICSERPQDVVLEIAELTQIGEYRLVAAASEKIRDVYFDTLDGALGARKLALRIREVNGEHWIALKGPDRLQTGATVERLEIEEPWSGRAVQEVLQALQTMGISIRSGVKALVEDHPKQSLEALGFCAVQNRKDHRIVRKVVGSQTPESVMLAELVVDTVTFQLDEQDVRHHEVEIEAKSPEGRKALPAMTSELVAQYGSVLRPLKYSKLAIGKALGAFAREGALQTLLDESGNLTPRAYDVLEAQFRRERQT